MINASSALPQYLISAIFVCARALPLFSMVYPPNFSIHVCCAPAFSTAATIFLAVCNSLAKISILPPRPPPVSLPATEPFSFLSEETFLFCHDSQLMFSSHLDID